MIQDDDSGLDPRETVHFGMSSDIIELSNSFPMGITGYTYEITRFDEFLPPRRRALELVDLYYTQFTSL